jgi:hypothetical protein
LLIGRENLVEDNKIGNSENDIKIVNYADFFLINHTNRSAEDFAGDDKIEDGENDIEIADCANFFLINHTDRDAENFAENDEIKDDKNNIGTTDYEEFFINYADRCAVSLHSANLIIIITAVKIADIYRS